MISPTQLEYLVAVDRYGSFSKAAQHCFITQPTLSMQIQKLEGELGVALFDRGRKPVQATPVGKRVIAQAYRALREFAGIGEVVREQREGVSGELRLGIIPTLGPYLLPRFIPDFLAAHSQVQVTVRELRTADMVDALRRDTLDAGIAATPLGMADIKETAIFYEPFHGFVSQGHRLARRSHLKRGDFEAGELLLLDHGHCLSGQLIQACMGSGAAGPASAPGRLQFVGGSLEGVMRMVASGHGITLLPELATLTLPADFQPLLRPFQEPVPARAVSLISHGEGIKTRLLDQLLRAVMDGVPERLREKDPAWTVMAVRTE